MQRKFSIGILSVFILLLGFGRMAQVALHSPLFGYANNYDFIKLSSTLGVWPDEPGVNPLEGHWSGPLSHYRTHGERDRGRRYLSSEILLVAPALGLSKLLQRLDGSRDHRFDLRMLGATKALFFALAAALLTWQFFRRSPWFGLASAAIFAVLIADPLNTLYFNTLYLECSTLIFSYLALGFGILLAAAERPSKSLLAAFCVALVLAGWSKMQHVGLPLTVTLAFAAIVARRWNPGSRRWLAAPFAAAVIALAGGAWNMAQPSMRGMVYSGATNTWLYTVLPAMSDKSAALASLGLPAECGAFVGKSWFDPGMQPGPCPQIFDLNHGVMLGTLLLNPSATARILAHSVEASRPFIVGFGQVEGQSYGQLADQGVYFSSVARGVDLMPAWLYEALLIVALAGGAVSLYFLLRGQPPAGSILCLLCNAVFTATWATSLLGDGYIDFARHIHLAQNTFLLAVPAGMLVLAQLPRRISRGSTTERQARVAPGA